MLKFVIQNVFHFVILFSDLFLNLGAKDFPEYHKLRIKYNLIDLIFETYLFFFYFSLFCGLEELFYILMIFFCFMYIFIVVASYYLIKSIYLYFAYDGFHRIKNPYIHALMYITSILAIYTFITLKKYSKNKINKSKKESNELKTGSTESNDSKIETNEPNHESNETQNESKIETNESSNYSDRVKIVVYNN